MPITDGFEATREIQNNQQWSDLPVVAMTTHVLESKKNRSVAVGFNDYLTKPIQSAQLKNILVKWLS